MNQTLEGRPIADIGRGLQGTTPGLSIQVPSGEVGSDPIIKIRGQIGSIEGEATPLILLDNVEIPSIQMVNPDDIESISFLKDGTAAIYGMNSANGAIVVTTKKDIKEKRKYPCRLIGDGLNRLIFLGWQTQLNIWSLE